MSQGNSVQPQGKQEAPQTIRKVLKAIAKKAKEQGGEAELPGTTVKIELAELAQLIKSLGPEPQQKKKKKAGGIG